MLDKIGSVASIVAAVTSILLFAYFVWDRRQSVRVRALYGFAEVSAQGESDEKLMTVQVTNLGSRPVALDKVFLYGPELKLGLMKDSLVRDDAAKLLTPENPSVSFCGPEDAVPAKDLIAVIAYDRRGGTYIHRVQPWRRRVKRWCRLRLTKKGRAARDVLLKLGLRAL